MEVEDAHLKTHNPLWLCTINLFNIVRQTTVNIGGYQKKWKNHTTCFSECSVTGGGGMQKIVGVIGKISCQMHTFAFITSCIEQARRNVKETDLYLGNYYFQALTQEHVKLLQQYGYWEHILKSRQNLIDNANSQQNQTG